MIIIPEIETVAILVPRTGSGSLYRAIQTRYQKSMLIYRHMEADGIPMGYDRWRKIGVVRNPVSRLWSLYKFLNNGFSARDPRYADKPSYRARVDEAKASVSMPFNEWLLTNRLAFAGGHSFQDGDDYWPVLMVRHWMPENCKSQFIYLRPDLGTEVFRFPEIEDLATQLDVKLERTNHTTKSEPIPELTPEAQTHIEKFFSWDLGAAS